jgi:Domain of unknown function (DUF4173)
MNLEVYRGHYLPTMAPVTARIARRQRTLSKTELAAWLALTLFADLAMFSLGAPGLALGLTGSMVALWCASPHKRTNARVLFLGAALLLTSASLLWVSSYGVAALGFAGLVAFTQAIRGARLPVLESVLSAPVDPRIYAPRLDALMRSLGRRQRSSRGGRFLAFTLALMSLAAFTGIFCLTNPTLRLWVNQVFTWFAEHLPDPVRIIFWVVSSVVGLALIRPTIGRALPWQEYQVPSATSSSSAAVFGYAVLMGLNVLFALNGVSDAAQLLSGAPPPGMTTQAYAHTGALWLTVALVLVNLLIGIRLNAALWVQTAARYLAYALMTQAFVLAALTFGRMGMHVSHGGLSDLHLIGFLGAGLVTYGLALVTYKIAKNGTLAFLIRRQLEGLAFAIFIYAITPTYAIAAQYNVNRITQGDERPLIQLDEALEHDESLLALLPLLKTRDEALQCHVYQSMPRHLHMGRGAHDGLVYVMLQDRLTTLQARPPSNAPDSSNCDPKPLLEKQQLLRTELGIRHGHAISF